MIPAAGVEALSSFEDRLLYHLVELTRGRPAGRAGGVTKEELRAALADDPQLPGWGDFIKTVQRMAGENLLATTSNFSDWRIWPTSDGQRRVDGWRREWVRNRPTRDRAIQRRILEELDERRRTSPTYYQYPRAPLDLDGLCAGLGISQEEYLYNARRLREQGKIEEPSIDQQTLADGWAFITEEGIRTLEAEFLSMPARPAHATDRRGDVAIPETDAGDPRKVFVVHGRDKYNRDAMFQFLRALGLDPMEWEQMVAATGNGSPYIGEVLDAGFRICQAVVVLLTGDDEARLRENLRKSNDPPYETELTPQPRPNVLFEAGMAMGRHHGRTILVQIGHIRAMSDIVGRHAVRFAGTVEDRIVLKNRLGSAGCTVNDRGVDWLTAGDFQS